MTVPSPARPVTAAPRLPYAYPGRKARVGLAVMRTVLVLLYLGGTWLISTNRVELYHVVEVGDGVVAAWIAAVVFMALTAANLLLDMKSVRADRAGVVLSQGFRRVDVPWTAVASFSHTIQCLVIELRGGTRREVELVAKEQAGNVAWSTTPTANLAADLEMLRRTGNVDLTRPAEVVERRGQLDQRDIVLLAVLAIAHLAIAAARTTGAIG